MDVPPSSIDVAILCGGQGTRLQKVISDRPKPMAEINDEPFLDYLIKQVASYGFKRFILCAGYKSTYIADYYKKQKDKLTYIISEETSQLGTAGALRNAQHLLTSNPILVLNGDSFCPANLHQLLEFHFNKNAAITIALAETRNTQDFGNITLNLKKKITGFNEKPKSPGPGIINAGIYAINKSAIASISKGKSMSLETELFPALIKKGVVYGFVTQKKLIDIGTPERLEMAKKNFLPKKS